MYPDERQNGLGDAALLMASRPAHAETHCNLHIVRYQPMSRARQNRLRNSREDSRRRAPARTVDWSMRAAGAS
jgi:hypothetical protein